MLWNWAPKAIPYKINNGSSACLGGPYSYLLRCCDSDPGLYTLLVYDGTRILKYKMATAIVWWATPEAASPPSNGQLQEAQNESESPVEGNGESPQSPSTPDTNAQPTAHHLLKPLYGSVVKVRYNNLWYSCVENVVSEIEAGFNQSKPLPCVGSSRVELKPVPRVPKVSPATSLCAALCDIQADKISAPQNVAGIMRSCVRAGPVNN